MASMKKKSLPLIIILSLATWLWNEYGNEFSTVQLPRGQTTSSDKQIETAFKNRQSDLQIEGAGTVVHVLPDDNKGSRHQRFIIKLNSGLTLLVAHNIDLAPRIPALRKGDEVAFYGEYEWTEKGGVMHWTHHDPGGRHVDGWLEHQGERYQ